jgi:hypothetical protein
MDSKFAFPMIMIFGMFLIVMTNEEIIFRFLFFCFLAVIYILNLIRIELEKLNSQKIEEDNTKEVEQYDKNS